MAIVSGLASLMAWLATKALDGIIGKWIAYLTIAWEKSASKSARAEYQKAVYDMKEKMANNYDDWKKWRDGET